MIEPEYGYSIKIRGGRSELARSRSLLSYRQLNTSLHGRETSTYKVSSPLILAPYGWVTIAETSLQRWSLGRRCPLRIAGRDGSNVAELMALVR